MHASTFLIGRGKEVVLVFIIATGICLGNLTPVSYKPGADREVENENTKEDQNCKNDFSLPSPMKLHLLLREDGKRLSAALKVSMFCTQHTRVHECFSAFGPIVVSCGPKEMRGKCPINLEPCSQCFFTRTV